MFDALFISRMYEIKLFISRSLKNAGLGFKCCQYEAIKYLLDTFYLVILRTYYITSRFTYHPATYPKRVILVGFNLSSI